MRNLRLVISYDGTDFHGWPRQPDAPTVQSCLEGKLERILGESVKVLGSGRTDAGVHASNQVANFKTTCRIPCKNLVKALNDLLPPTVRIKEAQEVPEDFHARYQARSKTYRYRILQAPNSSPFAWRFVWHYPFPLDRERMGKAARMLEGERDFTSFAGSVGMVREPPLQDEDGTCRDAVRTIFSSRLIWRPRPLILVYEVRGEGFLHHMVRNIVGTLVEVGKGTMTPQDIPRILEARDRRLAGPTAPARGLCLVKVEY